MLNEQPFFLFTVLAKADLGQQIAQFSNTWREQQNADLSGQDAVHCSVYGTRNKPCLIDYVSDGAPRLLICKGCTPRALMYKRIKLVEMQRICHNLALF